MRETECKEKESKWRGKGSEDRWPHKDPDPI